MAGEIIRLGDSTSHGGKVIEGSQTDICHGKPIAFIGHKVLCPKCKGTFPIVEGVQTTTIFGKGVALAGMKTACGASLIPSQFTDVVTPGDGGGGGTVPAPSAPPQKKSATQAAPANAAPEVANTAVPAAGGADSAPVPKTEKTIKRIWWSYGEDEIELNSFARHYVDLNVHAETENYAGGESISLTIRNDDGTELADGVAELAVSLKVGEDGTGKALNVFAGKTIMLGTIG